MEYQLIEKMKVDELKSFLKLRGLRVSGNKSELVARVFVASENNVKIVKTAEEVEHELKEDYTSKLLLDDGLVIPDPLKDTSDNWLTEEKGIIHWPKVSYGNIFNYLKFCTSDLGSDELSDYKTSKGYSYYNHGWMGELSINLINENYCVLRSDCRASQRINDPFHKLWVCIDRKSSKIIVGHCTCMAGMSETCNHIAGMLFRLEAVNIAGLNNPSCTTKPCEWLPNRSKVEPKKIKDVCLDRDDIKKRFTKKSVIPSPKKKYEPLIKCPLKPLKLNDIATALEEIAPLSTLTTAVPRPKIDFVREVITQRPEINTVSVDDVLLMSSDVDSFFENLEQISQDIITKIEVLTRGQSNNEAWYDCRKGVVTASKAHDILTRMRKFKGDNTLNLWNLFQKVAGMVFVNPNIPALKYGRDMESIALEKFVSVMKVKHRTINVQDCGLFLDESFPYIGASPDAIVNCECCGLSCLEIKCPYSISYLSPQDPSVKLAFMTENNTKLKKNHKYFTQCQLQMYVTRAKRCFFMVWTSHGNVIDEIAFDEEFCNELIKSICSFYKCYLEYTFGKSE